MQLIPRYLVKNRVNLVAVEAGFVTEYRPVYQRQIQIYRGIDNTVEFKLLNPDQKPIDSSLYIIRFQAFDENKNMIIDKTADVLDDGSSSSKGLFTVTLTESDLLSIKSQFISYVIYLTDINDKNIITYSDTHFGNSGVMKISSQAFPGAKSSKIIDSFFRENNDTDVYISSAIDAEPGINGNEALHTAVIYSNSYQGTVTVQATLENQITGSTEWADLITVEFDGTETEPTPINFNGVFNWIRFKTSTTPTDKISRILIRN